MKLLELFSYQIGNCTKCVFCIENQFGKASCPITREVISQYDLVNHLPCPLEPTQLKWTEVKKGKVFRSIHAGHIYVIEKDIVLETGEVLYDITCDTELHKGNKLNLKDAKKFCQDRYNISFREATEKEIKKYITKMGYDKNEKVEITSDLMKFIQNIFLKDACPICYNKNNPICDDCVNFDEFIFDDNKLAEINIQWRNSGGE